MIRDRSHFGAALVCALFILAGCTGQASHKPPKPERSLDGPVVLITLADLRADVVGALDGETSWTPGLDALAADSDWALRAVAPSSSPVPSMLSLATGTDPWQHGVLSHRFHSRAQELPTLAQMMGRLGFRTHLFAPLGRDLAVYGPFEGFDERTPISDGEALSEHLRHVDPSSSSFTWIHLPSVGFPYRDQRATLPSLPAPERDRIGRRELLQYADPEKPIPQPLLRDAALLYRHEVARADARLGDWLDALRESGGFASSLIIVTALHGTELGEHGQALFAQNLGRKAVEVPLIVKFPEGIQAPPAQESPVETARLWSTLAELAGGERRPVHLPSLLHESREPAFVSLFRHETSNRLSVVERRPDGVFQLTLSIPFAAPEPEFFAAQMVESGWKRYPIKTSPRKMQRRLDRSFAATPPMEGAGDAPLVKLERWSTDGESIAVDDPPLMDELTDRLLQRWRRFADHRRSPAFEHELRKNAPSRASETP